MQRDLAWTRRAATVLVAATLGAALGACAPRTAPLPPPGAARFPAFLYPAPPDGLASGPAAARHQVAWQWLQAGDFRAAERNFTAALKESGQAFYPAEAGLGYAALAQNDHRGAIQYFDRAVAANPAYVPALVGRGEAQLAIGENDGALTSFEAALAADPALTTVRSRVEVLRFRGLQDFVASARAAAQAGRLTEARSAYQQAIAASPESPFLHRELAELEHREGNVDAALGHAGRAAELDPADARAMVLMADLHERRGEFDKSLEALITAATLEPNEAIDARIDGLRAKAAFAAMPEPYRAIESSETVTRAQLAALIGVRLEELLKRSGRRAAVVVTDSRGSWAAPWILAVTRAGVMEVYPNYTFQPGSVVRRADLAAAASRALSLIAAENPRLAAPWRNARRRFPDVSPGNLSYPAASLAVEAGIMSPMADGSFQLSRPVTGQEALAAVTRLEALSGAPVR
ncbi:MAG: tetratricopeptide repeat protein [Acidobacteria bacterium]|nr:tetratricopeptide repeat protein [Acidobacteriota bacterium]MBA3886915.1 tetratricopeptide repeat protein [Acidobacteriota bacterium]